jgi:hypothetical protein
VARHGKVAGDSSTDEPRPSEHDDAHRRKYASWPSRAASPQLQLPLCLEPGTRLLAVLARLMLIPTPPRRCHRTRVSPLPRPREPEGR